MGIISIITISIVTAITLFFVDIPGSIIHLGYKIFGIKEFETKVYFDDIVLKLRSKKLFKNPKHPMLDKTFKTVIPDIHSVSKVYIYYAPRVDYYEDFYFTIKDNTKIRDFFKTFAKKFTSKITDEKDKQSIKKLLEIHLISDRSYENRIKKLENNKLEYIKATEGFEHEEFMELVRISPNEFMLHFE